MGRVSIDGCDVRISVKLSSFSFEANYLVWSLKKMKPYFTIVASTEIKSSVCIIVL
jgi:hypothetical protein